MIVTIHQPDFLPWLGFFDRWKKSDIFVVLDDVQFIRRGWQHRDRIKTSKGVRWLTVPVIKKGRYLQNINEVEINNATAWREEHLNLINSAYSNAVNFSKVFLSLREIYNQKHNLLIDFNMECLKYCANELNITVPFIFSSTLNIEEKGSQRLISIIQAMKGDVYLTGAGSRGYLEEKLFLDASIRVKWQEFDHPVYPQLYGKFQTGLSILDYLMVKDK